MVILPPDSNVFDRLDWYGMLRYWFDCPMAMVYLHCIVMLYLEPLLQGFQRLKGSAVVHSSEGLGTREWHRHAEAENTLRHFGQSVAEVWES